MTVHPALVERSRDAQASLVRFFADGGNAGQKPEAAIAHRLSTAQRLPD